MDKQTLTDILAKHSAGVKADLRGADLRSADLRGANLQCANLRWVDLRDADLRRADLRDANLQGANLRGADLQGMDLRGANLWGANLRETGLTCFQVGQYTAYYMSKNKMLRIGCEHHSLAYWKKNGKALAKKWELTKEEIEELTIFIRSRR